MGTNRNVFWAVGGALLVWLLVAGFSRGGMGGMGTMMGVGMGGAAFMLLACAIVIALLVFLVIWGINQLQRR